MTLAIDLIDKRFGRCIAIKSLHIRSTKDWLCRCDCGTEFIRRQNEIIKGLVYECPNCVFRRSEFYIGGKKFGRLHVLHEYKMEEWKDKSRPGEKKKHRIWKCKCECGTEKWISQQSITRGLTVSCGCYMQKNNSRFANPTLYPRRSKISCSSHPQAYGQWVTLNQKCYNSKYPKYPKWGGLGYTVCEKWRNSSEEFLNWLKENNWKIKMTVICKNGAKEFSPENCLLIPFSQYCKNIKEKIDLQRNGITYNGKTQTMKQWAKEYNMTYGALRSRMQKNNYDIDYCLRMAKNGNTGIWLKREDISDELLIDLYKKGHSYEQITELTGFHGVKYRLDKYKLEVRPRIRGDSYRYTVLIEKLLNDRKSYNEILIECQKIGKMDKYNLKRKLFLMEIKVKDYEILYPC